MQPTCNIIAHHVFFYTVSALIRKALDACLQTVGGIGKLMMKMKGLKEEARDRVEKKKTGAKMDPAAVDAAKKDSTPHVHCAVS